MCTDPELPTHDGWCLVSPPPKKVGIMEQPFTREEKIAVTRAYFTRLPTLDAGEEAAAGEAFLAAVAAGRAITGSQLLALPRGRKPAKSVKPKMADTITDIRALTWRLFLDAGLQIELQEWLEDLALVEGRPAPVGPPEFGEETAAKAAVLLIEHRVGVHPWLRQSDRLDLDAPVWGGRNCPPGLSLIPATHTVIAKIIYATGAAREVAPIVHAPMAHSPREYRRWLLPTEVVELLAARGHQT